jgi:subtilisin family serine protease
VEHDKIDPKLQRLIAVHAAGGLPTNPDNPEHLVHVYVTVSGDDFRGLAAAGFDVLSELGGSAIVILPIDQLERLAARDDVTAIVAPPVGKPMGVVHTVDQKAILLQKAYDVKSTAKPTGTKGAGIVIGIVDSGVNVLHDAFRTAAPDRKTRILFYWAQDDTIRPGGGPLWDRMGKVFTAADLDTEIAAHPSGHGMPDTLMDWGNDAKTESGHGTGVASVAAGSEWPTDPPAAQVLTGVAPEAQLIVVSSVKDDQAAIEFCFAKAEALAPPRPCVVNMSRGDHKVPHNGRSLLDQRVNTLLTAKAGRVLVVAAGNEGDRHNHARVSLPHPGSVTFDVSVGADEFALECLISGTKTGGVTVEVAPPLRRTGDARKFLKHNEVDKEDGHDRHKVTVSFAGTAGDPDWHTFVRVASIADPTVKSNWYVRAGIWQVKLETFQEAQPDIDIWLSNIDDNQKIKPLPGSTPAKEEALDPDAAFRRPREWILHTLRSPACGKDAIVVGAGDVSRTVSSLVFPRRRSSRGPSTDASIPALKRKPDLIAPGADVRVARFKKAATATGKPTSTSHVTSGSSFAAPFVTGAAALMLAHNPTLKQEDILKFLRAKVDPLTSNPRVTAWMTKYDLGDATIIGAGFLNMENAVTAAGTP